MKKSLLRACLGVTALITTLFPFVLLAQVDPAIQLQQEQRRQQRENDASLLKQTTLESAPSRFEAPGNVHEPKPLLRTPSISIKANGLLNNEEIKRIIQPFHTIELGEKRIALLLRKFNAALIQHGLITSHSRVSRLDIQNGDLEITLVAGQIEAIRDAGATQSSRISNAFPMQTNTTLQLEDLEQGVHQIQRLRLYQAEVRILPGQLPEASLIDVHLTESKAWWSQLGIDNQGSKSTGTARARASLTLDNRMGLLDSIGLTYVRSRSSEAAIASLVIPYGYNTYSLSQAIARFAQELPGNIEQSGTSKTTTVAWNRVIHLSSAGRDSLDFSLTHGDSSRKIEDIRLTSERLTALKLSVIRLRQGGNWRAWGETSLSQGVSWLGGRTNDTVTNKADPHADFSKLEGHAGLVLNIPLLKIQYIGQADIQHSRTGLFGPEQFRLGGMNSIRGFDESIAVGDRGYSHRHELHLSNAQLAPILTSGSPYIFADHGTARLIGGKPVHLFGAGLGLRLTEKHWATDIVIAKPINHNIESLATNWHFHLALRTDL